LILFLFSCQNKDVSVYVDPNIGSVAPLLTTKNPSVHRPNSMVRVFPVTKPGLNDRFLSDKIYGFALNMPAYRNGHVTELMPFTGSFKLKREEYASLYDHDLEEVHPWYHKVLLEDYNIKADWTTTERAVLYRFNYNGNDSCYLIFHSDKNASFKYNEQNVVQGCEEFENIKQYFYAEIGHPISSSGIIARNKTNPGKEITGNQIGIYLLFTKPEKPVEIRIGISYISEEQAARNLHNETSGKNFESIESESHKIWE
jgi:putative alpha-1,2-mannosidase